MIRTYTIDELEKLSGVSKRSISDYISKGLMRGPSHRGRGAVYSQRDLNTLLLIPRLRMLMHDAFASLKAVGVFLEVLSIGDIRSLAARKTEEGLVLSVRRLRVRQSLMGLMPQISPEKFDQVLDQLTPEQISSVDAGRIQIGAVIDMGKLFAYEQNISAGASEDSAIDTDNDATDTLPRLDSELSIDGGLEKTLTGIASKTLLAVEAIDDEASGTFLALKLDEISDRLNRVEQMLEDDTKPELC
jgi:DNA-binding transcriptional MerR regulator